MMNGFYPQTQVEPEASISSFCVQPKLIYTFLLRLTKI